MEQECSVLACRISAAPTCSRSGGVLVLQKSTPLSSTQLAHPPAAVGRTWQPLRWWYRCSLPGSADHDVQDDVLSHSRLASILLLVTLIGVIAFIPAALTSDDLHVVPPVAGMFVMTCLGVLLNKRGKTTSAGLLIIASLDTALIFSLLSYPHFTLTQNAVPIYDLFVLSDIIAVSLLPIRSILYISCYHSIFMLADIVLQPHTPDLQVLIAQTTYSFMVRPLTIQIVVALVTYLWVRNTMKALERANKAELIARLEHTIALQRQDLDEGIQQILQTLVQVANGNLDVRAPLAQQHVLWQVGVGLNTLLSRLQRANQSERELARVKMEIRRLITRVQEAKHRQVILWLPPGGTELDVLISELMGCLLRQQATGPQQRI
jgi:hypothetical protein